MDSVPSPRPANHRWTQLAGSADLSFTAEQVALLHRHLDLLLEYNTHLNLTAIRDRDVGEIRHTADALTLLPYLVGRRTIADVGSGGGVPGIPLAIALPHCRVTLIDSVGKKADALRQMVDALGLENVAVLNQRAETVRAKFDAVVARAVAPLPKLVAWCKPLLGKDGVLLAMKGRTGKEEAAAVQGVEVFDSPIGDGVIVRKVRKSGKVGEVMSSE